MIIWDLQLSLAVTFDPRSNSIFPHPPALGNEFRVCLLKTLQKKRSRNEVRFSSGIRLNLYK